MGALAVPIFSSVSILFHWSAPPAWLHLLRLGVLCHLGPLWLPSHLQQGQRCPQRAGMGFTEEYPSSGNRKVWFLWALGPPGALFPAGTGIRVSAFVHLFLTLAGAKQKSHRFLEWEPASSFPARNLNSHLLVHSSEKAQQQQQQDFNSQTAFGCLRCLFYFFGVCFYLKRKCMVNYSYR